MVLVWPLSHLRLGSCFKPGFLCHGPADLGAGSRSVRCNVGYQATSLVPLARDAHPPSQDNRKSAGIALAENHWSEHFQTTPFPDQVSRRTFPRVSLGRFHCSVYAIGPCFSSRRNCVEFCTRPSVQVPDKLQTSPICQVWRDCLIKTLSSQEQQRRDGRDYRRVLKHKLYLLPHAEKVQFPNPAWRGSRPPLEQRRVRP